MATAVQYKYPEVQNYVGGKFVDADVPRLDVFDPSSGDVISRVPLSAAREVDQAVRAAEAALPAWSATPIKERVQVFYRYKTLLEQNIESLAALVTQENGKIASEARAEILKSAELTEFGDHAVQLSEHGAKLVDPERRRPR
jgi:malonate-semialdehyde dehydrogenase (acetylating)/methylmalonate-semialdehyde dehydrogenase